MEDEYFRGEGEDNLREEEVKLEDKLLREVCEDLIKRSNVYKLEGEEYTVKHLNEAL